MTSNYSLYVNSSASALSKKTYTLAAKDPNNRNSARGLEMFEVSPVLPVAFGLGVAPTWPLIDHREPRATDSGFGDRFACF